ncbi:hypothetical protein [Spirosoma aerophilum]
MKTQRIDKIPATHANQELMVLSERHLGEWFQLLDSLQDAHAPTDQLVYCRKQIMRLQHDLYHLRNL